ncbi:hypothetical protein SCP_0606090 [Sparassis crispa]|uniref:Uncharacterized protein n=1 Tax=Sparassis crispa TaxID=139825 RepID=A0A401GR48_9APHY|nr:hypothetical protein SCP_0606090 [Sparassis crispa]GBE84630.1 hypothetical protein SCP_0606090 [Sparassis crispa]
MKITLRVQYQGARAREFAELKDDKSSPSTYIQNLEKDLGRFSIPAPESTIPVWLTGFVMCRWDTPKNSELHKAIRHGFQEACRSKPSLDRRLIKYMLLQDGEEKHSTLYSRIFRSSTSVGFSTLLRMPGSPVKPSSTLGSRIYPHTLGKAPRFPTSISTARRTRFSSPISRPSNFSGSLASKLSGGLESEALSANTIRRLANPHRKLSEPALDTLDATEQTLRRLSESSAVQSLLRNNSTDSVVVKTEPVSPVRPRAPAARQISPHSTHASGSSHPVAERAPLGLKVEPPTTSTASSSVLSSFTMKRPTRFSDTPKTSMTSSSLSRENSHTLTRELWDVRRQITALKAREDSLLQELRHPRPKVPDGPIDSRTDLPDGNRDVDEEITLMRVQLRRESTDRYAAESMLQEERRRRKQAEGIVDDCRRECSAPFVVPALMDAFVKLAQLTGEVITEVEGGTSASGW